MWFCGLVVEMRLISRFLNHVMEILTLTLTPRLDPFEVSNAKSHGNIYFDCPDCPDDSIEETRKLNGLPLPILAPQRLLGCGMRSKMTSHRGMFCQGECMLFDHKNSSIDAERKEVDADVYDMII